MIPSLPPGDYTDDDEQVADRQTPHGGTGSGHYVSGDERDRDPVQRLREVVAEVTRGRIPAPTRRGPRF